LSKYRHIADIREFTYGGHSQNTIDQCRHASASELCNIGNFYTLLTDCTINHPGNKSVSAQTKLGEYLSDLQAHGERIRYPYPVGSSNALPRWQRSQELRRLHQPIDIPGLRSLWLRAKPISQVTLAHPAGVRQCPNFNQLEGYSS